MEVGERLPTGAPNRNEGLYRRRMADIRCPIWATCPIASFETLLFRRGLGSLSRIVCPLDTPGGCVRHSIWIGNRLRLISACV